MKIVLHIKAARGLGEMLRQHQILVKWFPKGTMSPVAISDDDAICDILFAYCADYEPKPASGSTIAIPTCLFVSVECQLSPEEWAQIRLYEVRASKLWRISAIDDKINLDAFGKQPLIDKGGWASIRVPPALVYSKKMEPDDIVAFDWNNEYIIGKNVAATFTSELLTGFYLGQVFRKGGNDINISCSHLLSDFFAPPCLKATTVWDNDTIKKRDANKYSRYFVKGHLCLPNDAATSVTTDLCRTADPLDANSGSGWLVSRRVVEIVAQHKLLGWWFAPVLVEGSDVYEKYIHKIKRIESWVTSHRYNAFSQTSCKGIAAEKIIKCAS